MDQRQAWYRRRRNPPVWPLAVVAVMVLGAWGYVELSRRAPGAPVKPLDVIYRTLQLFTLDFDIPPAGRVPWQLWVAAFAAPLLTLRGIARLFRDQLRGILTQYLVRPRVVIFGANERASAILSTVERPGRWRDAIVVVDTNPSALTALTAPRVWTVPGDGVSRASLRRAAVADASSVVVCTGDNARNSAITTSVLGLRPASGPEIYVELEEPGLARTLEQGGRSAGVEIVPFSAVALCAAAVLDELEDEHGSPAFSLLTPERNGSAPVLALFGTGRLVDAMVLELHRRRQVHLLDDPGTASVVPRLVLFGPDAAQRRRSLATLVGTELHMLDIEAFDAPLDQAVELDAETARHLSRSRPLRQVFVLAPSDFDGGGIALTLARHLGPQARVVLVTESGSTPFASEIERQSGASAALASIRLFPVPEYAYSLPVLRAERMADRLARALYAVERRSGAAPWRRLGETERGEYLARAGSWLEEATTAPVRLSALVTPRPPEIPLLQALGFDRPVALARAGLRVDLQSLPVLRTAGQRLLDAGDDTAFAVWCEAARLQADVGEIARTTPDSPAGTTVRDVQELLRLKRALLGDPDARLAFAWERSSGSPSDRGHGSTAILLAGDGDDLERAALLHPLVTRSPGKVWVVAPRGPLRDAVIARGAVVPPGARDRPGDSTRRQALAVWRDVVVAGGEAADVRVVAMPAARAEDILLARALGATIGRVEVAEAVELGLLLLNGAAGVVPLPPDPMTVRAFLRPGRWPAELAAKREPLAAELHRRYMLRQRGRGRPDDLALQPWSALSPWLRRSNLAAVDDIPNKLAAAGLRLEAAHSRAVAVDGADFAVLRQQEEQLAELEHGRFTAERLLSGWTSGVRDPARFLSPDLQPWSDLDEEAKERDREAIRDLPEILAQHGLVVRPATP